MKKYILFLALIPGVPTTYAALSGDSSTIKRIDNSLRKYYAQHGVKGYDNGVGKFAVFCLENGYETDDIKYELLEDDVDNSALVEFDEEKFPYTESDTSKEKKRQEIFTLLKAAYRNVPNFQKEMPLSKLLVQGYVRNKVLGLNKEIHEDIIQLIASFLPQRIINQIDEALDLYYRYRLRDDYFDQKSRKGKFKEFCEKNGIKDVILLSEIACYKNYKNSNELDKCKFLGFDDSFPYRFSYEKSKKQEIFDLISTVSKFFDETSKEMSIEICFGFSQQIDSILLSVRKECKIWYIKQKARKLLKKPLPYYFQMLIFSGRTLSNERTLKDYNVEQNCKLHYMPVKNLSIEPTSGYNMFLDKKKRSKFIVEGYIREETLKLKKEVPADIIKQITRLLPMMFYVKNLSNNSMFTLDCVGTDTIQEVQEKITKKTTPTSENMILAYEGKFIDNKNSTITETEMASFSTIFLLGLYGRHRDGF